MRYDPNSPISFNPQVAIHISPGSSKQWRKANVGSKARLLCGENKSVEPISNFTPNQRDLGPVLNRRKPGIDTQGSQLMLSDICVNY
ncbi:hypothetical protein OIDMADRAFT_20984 [Oidiodendron maius Zn]|uniref:Uncharacterized protein n=1 Tax=Oidiodendron maius (strain Zn) TaxID=913774 RepID=A0A0C3GJ58_OIDMZ|nr:hypothetical protein OIDMADRAFT_20984 [Oidiodendron maius Zn]